MTVTAKAGMVDGPCTDLEASDCPLWGRGLAPIYDFGGQLNVPVAIGGVVVCPGDISGSTAKVLAGLWP